MDADPIKVGLGPDRFDFDPVLVVGVVSIKHDILVEVHQEKVQVAVVVKIGGRYADTVAFKAHAPVFANFPPLATASSPCGIAALVRGKAVAGGDRIYAHIDVDEPVVVQVL